MDISALIAQLSLVVVFGAAGLTKLRDRAGFRRAVSEFGLPPGVLRPVSALVPAAELGVAAALIPARTAAWGALAGLILLGTFSTVIAVSLAHGRAPACHCFGQLHSSPAGWSTLSRNAAFAGIAGLVAAGTFLWLGVGLVLAGLLLGRGARIGSDRERRETEDDGLPIGARAPAFALPDLAGAIVTLESLHATGSPVLLVFTDPGCGPCIAMAPTLGEWQRRHAKELSIVVVAKGERERNRAEAAKHALTSVLVQTNSEVADLYSAQATPTAVLVQADGRIGSPLAVGPAEIGALVAEQVGGFEPVFSLDEARELPEPGGLLRRDLLLRLTGAWGTAVALMVSPAALAETLSARGGGCPRGHKRCGDRCCHRTFVCRRRPGRRPKCVCPSGRKRCGTRCCPPTFVCRTRPGHPSRCVCRLGESACGNRCVRLQTDPVNCGSCGRRCRPGTACVDGRCQGGDGSGTGPAGTGPCTCNPGRACCKGQCTDLNTSQTNCGRCGVVCPAGKDCCEGHCVDKRSDPKDCGECGKRCASGEVCVGGRCRGSCPSGLTKCGDRCVDIANDFSNCGTCGRSCADLTSASAPACCGGHCVDLSSDVANCGACGHRCPPGCACGRTSDGRLGCFFGSGCTG